MSLHTLKEVLESDIPALKFESHSLNHYKTLVPDTELEIILGYQGVQAYGFVMLRVEGQRDSYLNRDGSIDVTLNTNMDRYYDLNSESDVALISDLLKKSLVVASQNFCDTVKNAQRAAFGQMSTGVIPADGVIT
jgi:hypothetical protein